MMASHFSRVMVVPQQVAILGVSRIEQRAVLNKKGKIKIKTVISLSLSF